MTRAPLFATFDGWLIEPDWASRVIAGAYDAKSPAERREIVAANPYSYLGVTRSSEDLAEGDHATDDDLLQRGADTLSTILAAGAFTPTGRSTLYAYRLTFAGHTQTGVVGALLVDGFEDGRVLTHENVRPNRARHLGRHLQWVGATSSPIALTHRADPQIVRVLDVATEREPAVDHVVEEVLHQVWPLEDDEAAIVAAGLAEATVYVTDGHHRSAAAISGLGYLRLGNYFLAKGDKARGNRYRAAAFTIARALLAEPYMSTDPKHQGITLHAIYHRPNGWDYIPRGRKIPCGESAMWGDYHTMELMCLVKREAEGKPYPQFFA